MTLPAPASTGLPVAAFRRTLGGALLEVRHRVGLAKSRAGGYRSPFPPRLRAGRITVVILSLLWLVAGLHAVDRTSAIVRIVGHDTAPSVAAANRIRTGLASANADFALSTLSGEDANGPFLADMRLQLRGIRNALVSAAGNVTYGDEERGPIATVLQGLGDYEQLVGRATASQGDQRRALAFAADDLLHWTVLPAAATLDRVNADHLTEDYAAYLGQWLLPGLTATALALLAALVTVQIDMAWTSRRILNPALVVATLAVVATTGFAAWTLVSARDAMRVAKSDAFDSVYALSTAQAIATDADAAQTFLLLADGDPARKARYADEDASRAARLLGSDAAVAVAAMTNGRPIDRLPGYIGDELANITFPGEGPAALALLKTWSAVVQDDAALRASDAAGQRSIAIASKIGAASGGARAAFARFDAALDRVLAINASAFSDAIAAAESATRPLVPGLIAAFVTMLAGTWFGIRRRLDDYRF